MNVSKSFGEKQECYFKIKFFPLHRKFWNKFRKIVNCILCMVFLLNNSVFSIKFSRFKRKKKLCRNAEKIQLVIKKALLRKFRENIEHNHLINWLKINCMFYFTEFQIG